MPLTELPLQEMKQKYVRAACFYVKNFDGRVPVAVIIPVH